MPRTSKRKNVESGDKENEVVVKKNAKTSQNDKIGSVQAPSSSKKVTDKWIPDAAVNFYENYGIKESISKIKNARFTGPFKVLSGEKDCTGMDILMIDRQTTDLPEMQTFLIFDGGRYAFWRDEPRQKEPFVVYCSDADAFPEIKVVGNIVEHALLHLCEGNKTKIEEILGTFDESWKKDVETIQKQRKKDKIGDAPHDVGIWVKMKDTVGYRCLVESPKNMKKILTTIKSTKDESIKSKQMAALDEEFRHVQIANDECDFGMGLEYGHWLFLANTEKVNTLTLFSLKLAYTFLGRQDFFKVLEETIKMRKDQKTN